MTADFAETCWHLRVRVAADGARARAGKTSRNHHRGSDEEHGHRRRHGRGPRRRAVHPGRSLAAARPDDAVLSEESGAGACRRASHPGPRWILDPIDGTVNYLYGLPYYAVSLAAEVDGVVVAGVVHTSGDRRRLDGDAGGGAYSRAAGRRVQRLGGSTETDLAQSLVATGFGYDAGRRAHQAAVVAGLAEHDPRHPPTRLRCAGSVPGGVRCSSTAYYEKGLNEWDMRRRRADRDARPAWSSPVCERDEPRHRFSARRAGPHPRRPARSAREARRRRRGLNGSCRRVESRRQVSSVGSVRRVSSWRCCRRTCRPAPGACRVPRSPG